MCSTVPPTATSRSPDHDAYSPVNVGNCVCDAASPSSHVPAIATGEPRHAPNDPSATPAPDAPDVHPWKSAPPVPAAGGGTRPTVGNGGGGAGCGTGSGSVPPASGSELDSDDDDSDDDGCSDEDCDDDDGGASVVAGFVVVDALVVVVLVAEVLVDGVTVTVTVRAGCGVRDPAGRGRSGLCCPVTRGGGEP